MHLCTSAKQTLCPLLYSRGQAPSPMHRLRDECESIMSSFLVPFPSLSALTYLPQGKGQLLGKFSCVQLSGVLLILPLLVSFSQLAQRGLYMSSTLMLRRNGAGCVRNVWGLQEEISCSSKVSLQPRGYGGGVKKGNIRPVIEV